jgi:hypothetical protein
LNRVPTKTCSGQPDRRIRLLLTAADVRRHHLRETIEAVRAGFIALSANR